LIRASDIRASANRGLPAFLLLCAVLLAGPVHAQALDGGPFVPTPQAVVDAMLKLAGVTARDVVVDLGSGDGRIVLTAARVHGARGRGVELDADLVESSNAEAKKSGLADRVRFVREDVTKTDIRDATVVTVYLLPDMMRQLRDKFLNELKPGTRIVSHDFDFGDNWFPDKRLVIDLEEKYGIPGADTSTLMLWTVPEPRRR
jgi:cyclopropane fatty-acyl-phospholipid synthase-like methyltransferase